MLSVAGVAGWIGLSFLLYSPPNEAVDLGEAGIDAHSRFLYLNDEGADGGLQGFPAGIAEFLVAYELKSNAMVLRTKNGGSSESSDSHVVDAKVEDCLKGALCRTAINTLHSYRTPENWREAWSGSKTEGSADAGGLLLVLSDSAALDDAGFLQGSGVLMRSGSERDMAALLEILRKFPIQSINRGLADFHRALPGKQQACAEGASAYCLIASGDEEGLRHDLALRASRAGEEISDYLLLDYSIRTRNDEMALIVLSAKMPSLQFSSDIKQLFAFSYHDLPRASANLIGSSKVDVDSVVGGHLTALGIAVQRNSRATIEVLLDHGAQELGDLLDAKYPLAPMMMRGNHQLFDLLLARTKERRYMPLLHRLLLDAAAYGEVDWLRKKKQELPILFDQAFVENAPRGATALRASALLPEAKTFDFLVGSGLDSCSAFSAEEFKSIRDRSSSMQGSMSWFSKRYREAGDVCKAPGSKLRKLQEK
jgi:hypothetical protein